MKDSLPLSLPWSVNITLAMGLGYTAILAALVGAHGSVVAYEIEADLAGRARDNLKHLSNVTVVGGSAAEARLPTADVIYVNAGATYPPASWLDALNVGGRLIFPLTPNDALGCMLLVTRITPTSYAASIEKVQSLHRDSNPDNTAWCAGTDWWLSTAAAK